MQVLTFSGVMLQGACTQPYSTWPGLHSDGDVLQNHPGYPDGIEVCIAFRGCITNQVGKFGKDFAI